MQSVAYSNSSIGSYQPVLGGAVIQPTNQVQIPNAASAVKHNKLPPQILPKVCDRHIAYCFIAYKRQIFYEISVFFDFQPNISNSSSVITQPKNTISMSTAQCEPNLTQQQTPQQPTQQQLNTQPMQSTQTPTAQPNAPMITTGRTVH